MSTGPGVLLAGRYRLEERIGRGGMAEVYRGHDELLDRTVAVKLFRSDTVSTDDPSDTAGRRRIESEMRTLAALHHPGLVTLYDASAGDAASDQLPYLVMEYVAGPTLTQRLARGPLPPADGASLGAELAAALEHVHENGVIHRDVKPANILLAERGGRIRPKLTDFGIARLTDGTRLTADGWTIGTANYLSPEQARGAAVGPASDIYALGLVLIECLTGAVAFPGNGVEAAVARLSRPPEVPTRFGPGWTSLLTAMTADDPAARPDAATVAQALAAAADAGGTQPTVPLAGAAMSGTRPLTASPAAVAAGTGAAGAAGAGAAAAAAAGAGDATALLSPGDRKRRGRLGLMAGAVVLVGALAALLAVALGGRNPPTSGVPNVSRTPPAATRSSSASSPASSPTEFNSSSPAHVAARHTARTTTAAAPKPKPEPAPKPKHGHGPHSGHGPGPSHGPGGGGPPGHR